MNKIERVDRVLQGEHVDYPPLSLWYHFGTQHGTGARFAGTALAYFNHYDFDFLKVMNDYFYPAPSGLEAVRSAEDLKQLDEFDVLSSPWQEQFNALEIIAEALQGRAYFIDTVFDAWQSLHRYLAAENLQDLMTRESEALQEALARINANLIAYARQSLKHGSAGIFLSIPAGSEILSREQFLTFVKPFAKELLQATADGGRLNTLHVHGQDLFFEEVLDLPAPVFNWWDRGPNGPSLQWVLQRISGCVMGGIDQTLVARRTRAFLREHVREGLQLGGQRRFFLANGCSIDTWTCPGAIEAIIDAARQGRRS